MIDVSMAAFEAFLAAERARLDPDYEALVAEEKARLAPEYEELYAKRVANAEAEQRARELRASEDAAQARGFILLHAQSQSQAALATQAFQSVADASAARQRRAYIAQLESELLQEQVLAEGLEKSESMQAEQLKLYAQGHGQQPSGRNPLRLHLNSAQGIASAPVGLEMVGTGIQPSSKGNQRQDVYVPGMPSVVPPISTGQREAGLRDQLVVVESEVREEAKILESYLEQQRRKERCPQLPTPEVAARLADEDKELSRLEAELSDAVSNQLVSEAAALRVVDDLQTQVLDLSGECGALMLGAKSTKERDGGALARRLASVLQAALPTGTCNSEGIYLDDILDRLINEAPQVRAMLRVASASDAEVCDATTAGNEGDVAWSTLQSRNEVRKLRRQLTEVESDLREQRQTAEELDSESQALQRLTRDELDDYEVELAEMQRENDLLRKQQPEWQRTQTRMLRLISDLQRKQSELARANANKPSFDVESSSASVKSTPSPKGQNGRRLWLSDYPPSPSADALSCVGNSHSAEPDAIAKDMRRLAAARSEGEALRQQMAKLEQEKSGLINSQQSLISYVQEKIPQLQRQAALRGAT
eukprot:TRINITY_DN74009_c0_g1_i1.p1 TRINITY_DN74009_c0_g1~~TRINITY_DN74009_c0_g1_i1.p1  ORF type:complete len:609 (-),score=111.42 TRINITY_DN74009_c0_g1_i1:255-2036(-)